MFLKSQDDFDHLERLEWIYIGGGGLLAEKCLMSGLHSLIYCNIPLHKTGVTKKLCYVDFRVLEHPYSSPLIQRSCLH